VAAGAQHREARQVVLSDNVDGTCNRRNSYRTQTEHQLASLSLCEQQAIFFVPNTLT